MINTHLWSEHIITQKHGWYTSTHNQYMSMHIHNRYMPIYICDQNIRLQIHDQYMCVHNAWSVRVCTQCMISTHIHMHTWSIHTSTHVHTDNIYRYTYTLSTYMYASMINTNIHTLHDQYMCVHSAWSIHISVQCMVSTCTHNHTWSTHVSTHLRHQNRSAHMHRMIDSHTSSSTGDFPRSPENSKFHRCLVL